MALSQILEDQLSNLQSIDISCNDLSDKDVQRIAGALESNKATPLSDVPLSLSSEEEEEEEDEPSRNDRRASDPKTACFGEENVFFQRGRRCSRAWTCE